MPSCNTTPRACAAGGSETVSLHRLREGVSAVEDCPQRPALSAAAPVLGPPATVARPHRRASAATALPSALHLVHTVPCLLVDCRMTARASLSG